ncbi:MAG: hypothetical protein RMJ44_07245 [Cytophagales bacterium]|nr:hypothetical protein [Bernardetiaceae bacterium]MDW8210869.1 hypothetical protein [Cytophagales bacterium]
MQKLLYCDPFVEILFEQPTGIIEIGWLPPSTYMCDDTCRKIFLTYAQLAERYRPWACLVYSKGSMYIIPPEVRHWVARNIFPRTYQAGVRVLAVVASDDIFTQLAVEQMLDENPFEDYHSRFFTSYEAARAWLMHQPVSGRSSCFLTSESLPS